MKRARLADLVLVTMAVIGLASTRAIAAGKVQGQSTINGKASALTYVAATTTEGLFDDTQRDVIVLLADKPVPADIDAADDVTLSLHARKGEFRALMLRIDATKKLVNVKVFEPGLEGLVMLPAASFEWTPGAVTAGGAAGRIRTKAPAKFEDMVLECDATFDVTVAAAATAASAGAAPPAAEAPDQSAALNQILLKHLTFTPDDFLTAVAGQQADVVKLYLDAGMAPDTPGGPGTPLFGAATPLVWAIMMKNTPMALALIHAGADANKADGNGMTPLTWAVESCEAEVVQALVDAKADVNHTRAGMTMLQEAGACPAAAAILKKAGAR